MRRLAWMILPVLAGCATFSEDARFTPVAEAVRERTGEQTLWVDSEGEAETVRGRVRELLAEPLTAQRAVQVALLSNPGLQAQYAEVGIAEAALVQASRWRGPTFSFARLGRDGEREYERGVFFDVLGLLTIPLSTKVQERNLEAVQNRAAADALRVALDARKAWFSAVAARESVNYAKQVKESAEASAELGRRMAAAGNFSRLDQAREQAFYADATARLALAEQQARAARERLVRLMGLWGEQLAFRLPERLPELPKEPTHGGDDLEAQALAQRLDVQAARRSTEALAASLGLTRATRYVSMLDFGLLSKSETDQPRQTGWEIELGLPLFDFGQARMARAERQYLQAVSRTMDVAVQARSEVREAYGAYRTAFDVARHYRDEIVPLRKRISEEMLLRYNGMLVSVFELLADSRQQVAAVNAYIESLRDFWLAESNLQMALTAGSPAGSMPAGGPGPVVAEGGAGGH